MLNPRLFISLVVLLTVPIPSLSLAVTAAPKIRDREIIQRLTRLEEGPTSIRLETRQGFELVTERFKSIEKSMDERFKSVDKRFESMNEPLSFIQALMLVVIASIFGLVGFIVYDRKTAFRPIERKLERLESELNHDLEPQSPEGSRLTRLIHAMRDRAKTDSEFAEILKA